MHLLFLLFQPRYCRALGENEIQELLAFKQKRQTESLGRGVVKELEECVPSDFRCEKVSTIFCFDKVFVNLSFSVS